MDPKDFALAICESFVRDANCLPSEVRLRINGWLRSRSLAKLATASDAFPECKASREQWSALLQVEAFFSKNASFRDDIRCLAKSLSSFNRAERLCRITNRRLDHYYVHRDRLDPDMRFWMDRAESWIFSTLGSFTEFLDRIPTLVRVTAGASALHSRRHSVPYLKVNKRISASSKAFPYLQALSRFYGYGNLKLEETNFNRIEVVPKSWKTHRTIACEPTGNLPLQLAFDSYAKDRLRIRGIDLSDQGRNQRLAVLGSLDGSYATLDMSMASDTVSYNAVCWLLPHEWFSYLDDIRVKEGTSRYDGFATRYAKFSSMGNGSTFAIETLLFSACCHAVGSKDHAVYGDDIVIRKEYVPNILRMLKFLGFTINVEKSHVDGPFRESCGVSSYVGVDITPVYVRGEPLNKSNLVHYINQLARVAVPYGALWELLRKLIPPHTRRVPYDGDTRSGLWIDCSTAWKTRVLRTRVRGHNYFAPYYLAYHLVADKHKTYDIRSQFLWFLDKAREAERATPQPSHGWLGRREWAMYSAFFSRGAVVRTCTTVPGPGLKTRSSWRPLRWDSMTSQPDHLYLWSDYIQTATK